MGQRYAGDRVASLRTALLDPAGCVCGVHCRLASGDSQGRGACVRAGVAGAGGVGAAGRERQCDGWPQVLNVQKVQMCRRKFGTTLKAAPQQPGNLPQVMGRTAAPLRDPLVVV